MLRKLVFVAFCAVLVKAQPSYTTVQGTIYLPVQGGLFTGQLQISNPVMIGTNGAFISQWAKTLSITSGAVSIALAPNDTSSPAGTEYVFRFVPTVNAGQPWLMYCSVPTAATANIATICGTSAGSTFTLNQLVHPATGAWLLEAVRNQVQWGLAGGHVHNSFIGHRTNAQIGHVLNSELGNNIQ